MAGFTFGIVFTSVGGSATGAYFDFVATFAAGISWVYIVNYIIYVTSALIKCTAIDTYLVRIQAECKQRAARTDRRGIKNDKKVIYSPNMCAIQQKKKKNRLVNTVCVHGVHI